MPNRNHYSLVARELKKRLNGKAFLTIPRREITEILRDMSGEPTTRIKSGVAAEMAQVLLEQGLRCYPTIENTDMTGTVRVFRPGGLFSNLVDLIIHPSLDTDKDIGHMLTKIKGNWDWATPAPGVSETLPTD